MLEHPGLDKNPHITQDQLSNIHNELYGWCLSRCGYDSTAAEDLLQEVYMALISGKALFKQESSLKTFLFSVAQHIANNQFRKLKLGFKLVTQISNEEATDEDQTTTNANRQNDEIWQAVRSLPAKQRDITELVFYRELTIQEAAHIMGITLGSARVHYQRAKQSLATKLGHAYT